MSQGPVGRESGDRFIGYSVHPLVSAFRAGRHLNSLRFDLVQSWTAGPYVPTAGNSMQWLASQVLLLDLEDEARESLRLAIISEVERLDKIRRSMGHAEDCLSLFSELNEGDDADESPQERLRYFNRAPEDVIAGLDNLIRSRLEGPPLFAYSLGKAVDAGLRPERLEAAMIGSEEVPMSRPRPLHRSSRVFATATSLVSYRLRIVSVDPGEAGPLEGWDDELQARATRFGLSDLIEGWSRGLRGEGMVAAIEGLAALIEAHLEGARSPGEGTLDSPDDVPYLGINFDESSGRIRREGLEQTVILSGQLQRWLLGSLLTARDEGLSYEYLRDKWDSMGGRCPSPNLETVCAAMHELCSSLRQLGIRTWKQRNKNYHLRLIGSST